MIHEILLTLPTVRERPVVDSLLAGKIIYLNCLDYSSKLNVKKRKRESIKSETEKVFMPFVASTISNLLIPLTIKHHVKTVTLQACWTFFLSKKYKHTSFFAFCSVSHTSGCAQLFTQLRWVHSGLVLCLHSPAHALL